MAGPSRTADADAHAAMYTVVLPQQKVLYVWTPKVACTSMKWFLAESAGLVPQQTLRVFNSSSDAMTVHDRNRVRFPSLNDVSDDVRRSALNDDTWIRFCIVRDPVDRCFSAWSHMVLLREPHLLESMGATEAMDGLRSADGSDAYLKFLESLERHRAVWFRDGHFSPQVDIARPAAFPFTHVVRVEELDRFFGTLSSHLAAQGVAPATPQRMNEGIRLPSERFNGSEALTRVQRLYAADFEWLDYPIERHRVASESFAFTDTEVQLIEEVRLRNERIYDLVRRSRAEGIRHAANLLLDGVTKRLQRVRCRRN